MFIYAEVTTLLLQLTLRAFFLQHSITAVGLAVCRHGHIFMMINLTSGEKHIYAIYVLQYLLLVAALQILFWWYDINCR